MARKGLSAELVVSAATELIEEHGYESFSLRELAGSLSVKPASLYNHASSVSEITSAVGRVALGRLSDCLAEAAADLEGAERLSAMAHAYRRFAKENAELYKVIADLPALDDDSLREDSHEVMRGLYGALAPFGLSDQDRVMFARFLRSAMHGFVSLEMAGYFREGTDVDASYRFLVESALGALGGGEGR